MDLTDRHVKTGIAHRYLKPTLALVDPENTRSMPAVIAAASGLDVLCHALESYTALPFNERHVRQGRFYGPLIRDIIPSVIFGLCGQLNWFPVISFGLLNIRRTMKHELI